MPIRLFKWRDFWIAASAISPKWAVGAREALEKRKKCGPAGRVRESRADAHSGLHATRRLEAVAGGSRWAAHAVVHVPQALVRRAKSGQLPTPQHPFEELLSYIPIKRKLSNALELMSEILHENFESIK